MRVRCVKRSPASAFLPFWALVLQLANSMFEGAASVSHQQEIYPIVGIGASAGGLEPIIELLSAMPARCGMAFLVVQHLDPSRPSELASIIAKSTPLRVLEAVEDAPIEVDHVYVIPPNTSMLVVQGRILLKPRSPSGVPPMPVDDLFDSLARDQGTNAIGIVLSGGGTDGATGMLAIKGCGGITFAQDETTARFNSMPRAATSVDSVDLSLPASKIAEELLRIARHPYIKASHDDAGIGASEDSLGRLFLRLRTECNVDFSCYKRGTVERRLARRLALHAVDDVDAYIKVIDANRDEARALCSDLLIRYTEFFRDPEAFEALGDTVFPHLLRGGDDGAPLRIWVPGCASGEEVYSIAICVLEYLSSRSLAKPVQIFGTDLSEEALEVARTGRYPENITRKVSPERLHRFFVKEGDRYRIAKSIRDLCTFARHNITHDPPFSRIDLISCRNLLIYLNPQLQRRVMPAFHFALKHDGMLMLGLSESVGSHSDLFAAVDDARSRLYNRRAVSTRGLAGLMQPRLMQRGARPVSSGLAEPTTEQTLQREIDRVALARFAPASVLCDEDFNILEFRGDTSAFLTHPPGAPTSQLQRLARPGVLRAVMQALRQVRDGAQTASKSSVRLDVGESPREASVEVVPVQLAEGDDRWFLVFFSLDDEAGTARRPQASAWQALKRLLAMPWARHARATPQQDEIARLQGELEAMREETRSLIDQYEAAVAQLKTFGEEMLSSNEEFQSTNEELETAKEELQSLNEELTTTNDELGFRNRELKVVHDQVARARDYANALIDTMSQPMLVLDADLRVVRANHAFYGMFRSQPSETLHASLYALGSGQWDRPELRELLEHLLPRRTQVRNYEMTAEFPRVGRRTMRLNASRVTWPQEALILLMIEDVTERQRALDQLTSADRQKDEFLAMLAHELRNPLAAMTRALHVSLHEDASPEVKQQALAVMARQLGSQVRMVDDLLDVSRITRGIVQLQVQRIDLAQTVQRACEGLRDLVDARRHRLEVQLPPTGLIVDGDAQRLEQVVTNLLGNAIKYTPPGGRLDVSLAREGDWAVLTVTDSGIGMTKELLDIVFDIFVQGDPAVGNSAGGLGVGLAIVRRLVELHGGTVQARSAGLSRGSSFVARLPAIAGAVTPLPEERPQEATDPLAPAVRRKVLVIDDNVDAAQSTEALLKLDDHDVRVAHNGPSALQMMKDFAPEIVLLDIGLPGMDGYEICRRIRALPDQQGALVLAVTGYGRAADIAKAREAGFSGHLTKPVAPGRLQQILRQGNL